MNRKTLFSLLVGSVLSAVIVACSGSGTAAMPAIPELSLAEMSAAIQDQFKVAIAEMRQDEENLAVNGRVGMLFDAYARPQEAAVFYARARFLEPENFKWAYLQGLKLAQLGDREGAIEALEKALELRPGYPGAQLELAKLVNEQGDAQRSIELLVQLTERNPTNSRARHEYGRVLLEQGDAEAAIQSLRVALGLSNHYGQAHYTLAQAYRKLGDSEAAGIHLALFERYRRFQPGHNDALLRNIAALNKSDANKLERSLLLSATGDNEAAAKLLEEVAAVSPDDATPHINLIAIYGELREFDKAQQHADIALSINPQSLELLDNIGIMRLRQQRYDEAGEMFRQAIAVDPQYAIPHRNLGALREVQDDLQGAIESYQRAYALDPYDSQVRNRLARALLNNNQPEDAIEVVAFLTSYSHADIAVSLQTLGRAYEMVGDNEGAVDAFKRATVAARLRGQMGIANRAAAQLDYARRLLQQ